MSRIRRAIGSSLGTVEGGFRTNWLPLVSLVGLIALAVIGLREGWLPSEVEGEIFGFDTELVVVAAVAGFLGSFVHVLNRAIRGQFEEQAILTKILYALMRPLGGAMLGLFVLGVFASGLVAMPIGGTEAEVIGGIPKEPAFIFSAAFIAGLVDEFVINIVNRFIALFGSTETADTPGPRQS